MELENYNFIKKRNLYNINVTLLLSLLLVQKSKKKSRRYWVRNIFKKRSAQGAFHTLIQEMRLSDREKHFNYLRMSKESFDILVCIVGPKLNKLDTVREPISARERLALTIRYLASGDSMVSISFAFRIGKSTTSQIIRETCTILWDTLNETVLLNPTETAWIEIAEDFNKQWNLPHCIGALDGKHVVIQAPPNSGSMYYNYKGSHSIVLLAMCDANYRFTLVDIGAPGRQSDGGIFKNSQICKLLTSNKLHLPPPSPIEYSGEPMNYYIAADEAFPLTTNIMRPYPGHYLCQNKRIFNYRLSRGRRLIENSFGILASRWRILRKPIICSLPTVENIIKATVCLHNWLITDGRSATKNSGKYCPSNYVDREFEDAQLIDGQWRTDGLGNNLIPINRVGSNMYTKSAHIMRDQLTTYFLLDGAVDFQWNK